MCTIYNFLGGPGNHRCDIYPSIVWIYFRNIYFGQVDENVDRQETSVYLDSPEITVPENTLYKKILANTQDAIFSKSSSNGEHWKNKRFLAFTRVCCQRKCKKTSVNTGTHNNFRAFTERWTLENMRFLEFPWIRHSRKIQENCRKPLWTREYTMLSVR